LSGAKTKKDAVEKALVDFIKRRKAKKLLQLEGKIEPFLHASSFSREGENTQ